MLLPLGLLPPLLAGIFSCNLMAKYLVTGGAGFIGSHIVEQLLAGGDSVRVLDNFLTSSRTNLANVMSRIEFIEGDIRDGASCQRAVAGMDYVLHQAALASVPRSIDQPIESTDINVLGTVHLLNAAVRAGVKRFVYAGSSSAYGDQPIPAKHEELLTRPMSPYASAKLAGELFCAAFSHSFGLETACLRYFNVFGPRQDPNSLYSAVVPRFLTAMLAGKPPTIFGDGTQSRDFTYVENAVRANILAATAPGIFKGDTMNIGCGESYSLLDLIREINGLLGTKIEPVFALRRIGDVQNSLADISLARKKIGYEVTVGFKEGLRKTLAAYRGVKLKSGIGVSPRRNEKVTSREA